MTKRINPPKWVKDLARQYPSIAAILKKYPPHQRLGTGGFKWVYRSGKFAVGITDELDQLKEERYILNYLCKIGLPVIEVFEWKYASNAGAMIMKLYRHPGKSITKQQKEQCRKFAALLRKKQIYVDDLQILIDEKGQIVIFDPYELRENSEITDEYYFFFGNRVIISDGDTVRRE